MAKKKKHRHHISTITKLSIVIGCFVLIVVGVSVWYQHNTQLATYTLVQSKITELETLQKENELQTIDIKQLRYQADEAKQQINKLDLVASYNNLEQLKSKTTTAQALLDEAIYKRQAEEAAQAALAQKRESAIAASGSTSSLGTFVLPIIMYHKPPANFAEQMAALKVKGYTTIHMNDVASFIAGQTKLPPKAAVITFDDGFAVQKNIMGILQKNNQKATLYLIEGGNMSHYCIGLLRKNTSCGDDYLSIQDVKNMMSSNLIEIGDHTVDHPNMASLSETDQQFQIQTNKAYLEQTFGVPITTFAYPYGNYNGVTLKLLKQNGFLTAVTTQPGVVQSLAQPLLLRRIRSTLELP